MFYVCVCVCVRAMYDFGPVSLFTTWCHYTTIQMNSCAVSRKAARDALNLTYIYEIWRLIQLQMSYVQVCVQSLNTVQHFPRITTLVIGNNQLIFIITSPSGLEQCRSRCVNRVTALSIIHPPMEPHLCGYHSLIGHVQWDSEPCYPLKPV